MKAVVRAAFVVVVTLLTGCAGMTLPGKSTQQPRKISFRAYIDGSDYVKIQDGRLWYEHLNWNLPGKEGGADEPTFINGVPWKPVWQGRISEPYTKLDTALKHKAVRDITLTIHEARGTVSIVQHPGKSNDDTLTILFNDDLIGSAAWYDVTIGW